MRRAGVVPSSQSTQEKRINAGFVLFALSLLATFVVFALVLAGVILNQTRKTADRQTVRRF